MKCTKRKQVIKKEVAPRHLSSADLAVLRVMAIERGLDSAIPDKIHPES